MSRRSWRVVVVLGVLIAGCSSDDDADPPSEDSVTTEDSAAAEDSVATEVPSSAESTSSTPSPTEPSPQETTTTGETSPQQTTTEPAAEGSSATDQSAAELESLASRPWASPDDLHESPEAAVEAFLEWVASNATFGPDDVVIVEYRAGDQRSGEVEVVFEEPSFDMSSDTQTRPVMTVLTRRSGPQDGWWVIGAVTTGLAVAQPRADDVVGSTFVLELTNDFISSGLDVALFAAGDSTPIYAAVANGGGVFTTGRRVAEVDSASCADVPGPGGRGVEFFPSVCDGPAAAGTPEGTLIVWTDGGITTVPVVFVGGGGS